MPLTTPDKIVQAANAATRATLEDLTLPIDYTDGTAVDPPAGTKFTTQQEIDDFLTDNSATNFKHVKLAFDAVPDSIAHDVTLALAAGVHRPASPASIWAFEFRRKRFTEAGTLTFQGPGSASYTELVASQSITGLQLDGGDPYLDFAGTPFAGLDLSGTFAVLSTGQVTLIHNHTDSRLYVINALSPDPTGGACVVGQPSAVLRNSLDDSSTFLGATSVFEFHTTFPHAVAVNDLLFDPFGGNSVAVFVQASNVIFTQCIVDNLSMIAAFGKTPNGGGVVVQANGWAVLTRSSLRGVRPATSGYDAPLIMSAGARAALNWCYVGGGEDPIQMTYARVLTMINTVIDQVGVTRSLSVTGPGSALSTLGVAGKHTEIRGAAGIGILVDQNAVVVDGPFEFSDCTGPCVSLKSGIVNVSGLIDLGGNSDVGIEVVGPGGSVQITGATDVTGSVGDIRIGGDVVSYTELDVDGSLLDGSSEIRRV